MHTGLMLSIPGYLVVYYGLLLIVPFEKRASNTSVLVFTFTSDHLLVCRKLGAFAPGAWKFGYTCSRIDTIASDEATI